jgi:hypothetical protein
MNRPEAIAALCDILPPGSIVYALRRSGGIRTQALDLYAFRPTDGHCVRILLTAMVATALGFKRNKTGALIVTGWSTDAAWHVTQQLSYELHGFVGKGAGATHPGIPCDVTHADNYRAGHSLRSEWL